ncbi:hypothetical protein CfE428DRAFT_2616 [Chthoniobacter flavus Ellin428]|uniref:Uncharacterized protein n=1 Tax=Chthoniobacter flavus Ellin428 TaxID=497964 RepID=B4D115_9BACT|nr:hypothetical protein [Chthoniobacter flavus]EDY20027.1 hypothetical protein CfE428DRAFT_2616 [Chthoniobacter flavus Ellin428]TCO93928.1 hypothetical protein EV701_10314 [Chthoniobacter flavus]
MSSFRSAILPLVAAVLVLTMPARAVEKWFYQPTNLLVDKNVDQIEVLWKRAAAAGYTHVLLADSKFTRLSEMNARYFHNVERVKAIAAKLNIEIVPALFPIGYSNDLLGRDPNLVEGPPVKDVPLVVRGGVAHVDDPDAPTLPGGDFRDLKKWTWKDSFIVADNGAARVSDAAGKNARIVQHLAVKPWRQYHVSVRIKTQDFQGTPMIKALPAKEDGRSLQWTNLDVKPTQDWTVHDVVFNSLGYDDVNLYFGMWPAGKGSLWWSDARIEEVAFLNMTRRPGTPLVVKTADGKVLTEGKDFESLSDPKMGRTPYAGEYDSWHEPPMLRTKLPDGTKLLASYYHAVTIYEHQAAMCLSEPKTYELLRDQAKRVVAAWDAKGYMLSHDELRVVNWCEACQSRHLTPGQMLADNVSRCVAIMHEVAPGARLYTWNDMFDPNHNAVPGPYYLVNGPFTGSWEGLPKDVTIMNWNSDKKEKSLQFFAERGNPQIIAGYYDSKPERIRDWLTAAKAVPGGVQGVMYTTWRNDYSQLEKFSALVDEAAK